MTLAPWPGMGECPLFWGALSLQHFPGAQRLALQVKQIWFIFSPLSLALCSDFFILSLFSLRDNNISDRGICKLVEHALRCEQLQKLA